MLERFRHKRPIQNENNHYSPYAHLIPIILALSSPTLASTSSHLSPQFRVTTANLLPTAQSIVDYAYSQNPITGSAPIVEKFGDEDCYEYKPALTNPYYYDTKGNLKRVQAYPLVFYNDTSTQSDDINVICIHPNILNFVDKKSKQLKLNTIQSLTFKLFHEYHHLQKKDNRGKIPDGKDEENEADAAAIRLLRSTDLSSIPYQSSISKKTVVEIFKASQQPNVAA